jgi:hypothetical protein
LGGEHAHIARNFAAPEEVQHRRAQASGHQ